MNFSFNATWEAASRRWLNSPLQKMYAVSSHAGLHALSDEALSQRCAQTLAGETGWLQEAVAKAAQHSRSWLRGNSAREFDRLLGCIALAVEAFRRRPADLPAGAGLYVEQIITAISLVGGCLVQMDTGEGKTYALLPAAFALATVQPCVYIVCANDYLARRDHERTRSFWEFVGLGGQLGLYTEGGDRAELQKRIIYTTLRALLFEAIEADISDHRRLVGIQYTGAVIVDEVDAILLDQGDVNFVNSAMLPDKGFDWNFALTFCRTLVRDLEVKVDDVGLEATLEPAGNEKLRQACQQAGILREHWRWIRFAVESAYLAVHVVKEGTHYVIDAESQRIAAIDLTTGRVNWGRRDWWITPLQYERGYHRPARSVSLNESNAFSLLRRFSQLCGMSGTLMDDWVEYMSCYGMIPVVVAPRKTRHSGVLEEIVVQNKEIAVRLLTRLVLAEAHKGRPCLVGCQSISDAEKLFASINDRKGPEVQFLELVTGKNDAQIAEQFAAAGRVGSVLVATQLAGRGVDIRPTPEAITNGGMALFCLEHAEQARHDRQFLGRVGRQGDPYTARFICSYEDRLMSHIPDWNRKLINNLFQMLEDPEEGVQNSLLGTSIRQSQKLRRFRQYNEREWLRILNEINSYPQSVRRRWFSLFQLPDRHGGWEEPSQVFLEEIINAYLDVHVQPLLRGFRARYISLRTAEKLLETLGKTLGVNPVQLGRLEAHSREMAVERIREDLLAALKACFDEMKRIATARQELLEQIGPAHDHLVSMISALTGHIDTIRNRLRALAQAESGPSADQHAEGEVLVEPGERPRNTVAPSSPEWLAVINLPATLRQELADLPDASGLQAVLSQVDILMVELNYLTPAAIEPVRAILSALEKVEQEATILLEKSLPVEAMLQCYDEAYTTPRTVAHAVLLNTWAQFIDRKDNAVATTKQYGLAALPRSSLLRRKIKQILRESQDALYGEMLRELLQSRQKLAARHALLQLREHANDLPRIVPGATAPPPPPIFFPLLPAGVAATVAPGGPPQALPPADALVPPAQAAAPGLSSPLDGSASAARPRQQLPPLLIAQYAGAGGRDKLKPEQRKYEIEQFFEENPTLELTDSESLSRALQGWRANQSAHGIEKSRRLDNQACVQGFLRFLHARGIVSHLPENRVNIQGRLLGLLDNITGFKASLLYGSLTLMMVIYALFNTLSHLPRYHALGPVGNLLDLAFFSGLYGTGSLAAPTVGCLILAALPTYLLTGAWCAPEAQALPITRIFYWLAQLAGCTFLAWLASPPHVPFHFFGQAGLIVLTSLLLCRGVQFTFLLARRETGIELTSLFIIVNLAFILLPAVFFELNRPPAVWMAGLLGLSVCLGLRRWNRAAVQIGSIRVLDSQVGLTETIQVERFIPGNSGATPHLVALLVAGGLYAAPTPMTAWLRHLPMSPGAAVSVLLGACYAGSLFVVLRQLLAARFAFDVWRSRLHYANQSVVGADTDAALASVLDAAKRSLLRREFALQLAMMVAVMLLLRRLSLPSTGFPLSLVLIPILALLVELSWISVGELYGYFSAGIGTAHEQEMIYEEEDSKIGDEAKPALWRKVLKYILLLLPALEGIEYIVNKAEATSKFFQWIKQHIF